jgi:DNA-directed RNA polymerase specialized sigma24 family protein
MSASELLRSDQECLKAYEEWDDDALARAARTGDRDARNALYLRHLALVRKLGAYAKNIVRVVTWAGRKNVPIEAEDVDQQAFVAFCDVLAAWSPDGAEAFIHCLKRRLPWLLRHYVDAVLADKGGDSYVRTIPFDDLSDDDQTKIALDKGGPGTSEQAEANVAWGDHMRRVPLMLRETVALRYAYDLTSVKVGHVTGRSKRAINRRLHLALELLRAGMGEEGVKRKT